jgi:hypothetical protein
LVVALILIAPPHAHAAIIGTSQSFPDENLANAIDFDMSERAPEFVGPAAFNDADLARTFG